MEHAELRSAPLSMFSLLEKGLRNSCLNRCWGGREERLGYGGKVGGRQGWGSEGRLGGGRDGEVREGRWSEGGKGGGEGGKGGGEGGNVGC